MENENPQDLRTRTTDFALRIIKLYTSLPKTSEAQVLGKQVLRSGTSVGANYREANECLGKKDFVHRLRIARKECKETEHWLMLISEANPEFDDRMKELFSECGELRNILSAIIGKAKV